MYGTTEDKESMRIPFSGLDFAIANMYAGSPLNASGIISWKGSQT